MSDRDGVISWNTLIIAIVIDIYIVISLVMIEIVHNDPIYIIISLGILNQAISYIDM